MDIQFQLKSGEQILLRADENNYELCRTRNRTDRKTGKVVEEWEPFKWFASLEQAFNKIIDLKVKASDAHTLDELKQDLIAARQDVSTEWRTTL
jgi:hypothetical protein